MTDTEPTFRHGTTTGYRRHKCRCNDYCTANAASAKRWRERNPERQRAYQVKKYAADPERAKREAAAWFAANPDRVRANTARYRRENAKAVKLRKAEYYAANADKIKAKVAVAKPIYRNAHPEVFREMARRRRAALASADVRRVTENDWRRLCGRYRDRCAYCGGDGPLTRDHVVPISRGGRHAIGNLLPACKACNSSKHALLLVEWRKRRRRREAQVHRPERAA